MSANPAAPTTSECEAEEIATAVVTEPCLDADLIIVGAGCAGLSLATRLIRRASPLRVLLVEARLEYTNDRTWCFWSDQAQNYEGLTCHTWPSWSFDIEGQAAVQHGTDELVYACVPSDKFYAEALDLIERSATVTLRTGTAVDAIDESGTSVRVECAGHQLHARHVIDTRPEPSSESGDMKQLFLGREIICEDDVFDPGMAGLMTDMTADEFGFRFTYVLPLSPRRALIEETRFTQAMVPASRLATRLDQTLERLCAGSNFDCIREEKGVIPMSCHRSGSGGSNRVVKAGSVGGAVRASTGYAFTRIQRWADMCADELLGGRGPIGHPDDPAWVREVDRLFLRVLAVHPSLAPSLFMALGHKLSGNALVRFLSDGASPLDFLKVALVLPKRPFLRELALSISEKTFSRAS